MKTPLSCGRVKTELFKNVTASIYHPSEHALGSLGSREGMLLVCFFLSKFECRISLSNIEFHFQIANFECHSVFVWKEIFLKGPRVDADLFYTDKEDAFSKRSGYLWTGPKI